MNSDIYDDNNKITEKYEKKIVDENSIKYHNKSSILRSEIIVLDENDIQSVIDGNLSDEKKKELLRGIISNINLEDKKSEEYASYIFRYLLNRDGSYDDNEIEFITYYTIYLNYHKMKYDLHGNVRSGYEDAKMPSVSIDQHVYGLDNAYAAYGLSTVFISSELSIKPFREGDKDSLFSYLQIISHEMVHYKQDYEATHGLLTESSFNNILHEVIVQQEYDDANRNYRFREIEVEAQIESMRYAIELAQEFFPSYASFQERMFVERENYLMEEALSFQFDDASIFALRDFYDIGLLSIAVSSGTKRVGPRKLLEKYPQLLSFFHENGQMRSEEELLLRYKELKDNNSSIANIYEMFLVYIYHKDPILRNTNLSSDLLNAKKDFIYSQIQKENNYIEQIKEMIYYRERSIRKIVKRWDINIEEIIEQRRKRIESYKMFLESIIEINEIDISTLSEIIDKQLNDYRKILDKIKKNIEIENIMTIDSVYDNDNKTK